MKDEIEALSKEVVKLDLTLKAHFEDDSRSLAEISRRLDGITDAAVAGIIGAAITL